MSKKIAVVCGPTACGKTALAVELALALDGEVVSADSMQVYRKLDIGTAKPAGEEKKGVPHHMLDVADPSEDWSVARYVMDAAPIVDDILSRGRLPIVAGGTGLYIDALIAGREFAPFAPDSGLRGELERRTEAEGLEVLYRELERADPEAAVRIHPNDRKRIIRALEVYYTSGKTISQHDRETKALPPRYDAVKVGLRFADRADMRERIDARVDEMFARGLVEEVRELAAVLSPDCTAMQAIGYKEFVAALNGECTIEEAADQVRQSSRRYAKRQLTWFRRNKSIHWLACGRGEILSQARRILQENDS